MRRLAFNGFVKKHPNHRLSAVLSIILLSIVLSTGLTGCITDADPDPGQTVTMAIGDTQVFTIEGTSYREDSGFAWYRKNGDNVVLQTSGTGETSTFEFVADPEKVSNKLSIICVMASSFTENTPFLILLYFEDGYIPLDYREWDIALSQEPPVWQGDYIVENSLDLLFISQNGYDEITGDLIIEETQISSLDGLGGVKKIGGDLQIKGNDNLTDIEGLEGLTAVSGMVYISQNSKLESVENLKNLVSAGTDLIISHNPALTALGLTSMNSVGDVLSITYNGELCTSLAEDLEAQLLSGGGIGGSVNIFGNQDCSAL